MRTSGVLMPISSLPSPYGIGTMGKDARKFVDFLVKGGQTYWQILPICPTSYGDSPYQSFSSFAGNPYFIDLEYLCKDKLLTKKECESFDWGGSEKYIDYGVMYESRYALLKKAYARFVKNVPQDYEDFCENEKEWLDEYALFMALKDANDGKAWSEWDDDLRLRKKKALDTASKEYAEDINICFSSSGEALKHMRTAKESRLLVMFRSM
jgi:4-alpha-glucanotransferase